jgi:predicted choloylglycine hydrolase
MNMKIKTQTIELKGSYYEIGQMYGNVVSSIHPLKKLHTSGFKGFDHSELKKAKAMFSKWCPGLNEELEGFANALQVSPLLVLYYGMTYLRPNCSQIALLPSMTQNGTPLLARNYEFSHELEDFTLVKTQVSGKYAHLGTSVLHFGRDDGFNECGLAVTMTSCGFPVGSASYMRQPKVIGLQFWAVIRSLLENCKDVYEALYFMKEMPIAYNLNLMLVDKSGHIALVETLDGHKAVKQIDSTGSEQYLFTTNHPVLPDIIPYEPQAMRHSLQRYEWIRQKLSQADTLTTEDLKEMLLSKYPEGVCCHFFNEFFGTTKSMIIDPASGTIELCWGGRQENEWSKYNIHDTLAFREKEIEIHFDTFNPEIGEFIPL